MFSLSSFLLQVYSLAQDTIVLLLEFNPDLSSLLDWVVDRCFTGSSQVADGCFLALATIFATRWVLRYHCANRKFAFCTLCVSRCSNPTTCDLQDWPFRIDVALFFAKFYVCVPRHTYSSSSTSY